MSDETERENLAEAEGYVRHFAGLTDAGDWGHVATILDEYDRRGQMIDGLKHRLECEASFTAAHQASALKWAAIVAEQKDDIESLRVERDAALGLLREAVEELQDMIGYVPEYFREKWRYDETIDRLRAALVERTT